MRSAFHGAADIGTIGQAASLHLQMAIANFGVEEWTNFHDSGHARLAKVVPEPCEWRDGYAYPHGKSGLGMDIHENAAKIYPSSRFHAAHPPHGWHDARLLGVSEENS